MQTIERTLNQNLAKNPALLTFLHIFFIPSSYIGKNAHLCSNYNDQLFDIMLSLV